LSLTGHRRSSKLLRYAPENKSSPKGSDWKIATEKLKIMYKIQK